MSYNYLRDYDPAVGRYVESDPAGLRGGINTYAYTGGNPISRIDPWGLYTEAVGWSGVGVGESQFGHFSLDVNGWNYSWAPPGQWDSQFPFADDYAQHNQAFRDGSGVILNLTPQQETDLQACLVASSGKYNVFSNNCGTAPQACLTKVGVKFSHALRPNKIIENLLKSPQAVAPTSYPGPQRDLSPFDNPYLWGF